MNETLIALCREVFLYGVLPALCVLVLVRFAMSIGKIKSWCTGLWIWPRSQLNRIENKLIHIERELTNLFKQGERLMAVSKEIKDLTQKIDEATNAVAARIDALKGAIKNSMTDAEVAEVKAGLQAEVDRLTVLGSDPDNPVPPSPPIP